jgi:hypothetical protein
VNGWHIDEAALSAWVEGTSGSIVAASVEQHLVRCEQCRNAVAGLVPVESVPGDWDHVLAEVSAGRSGRAEHALRRLGLGVGDAVVIGAAPVLRVAWVAALGLVLGFILLASLLGHDGGRAVFLLVAPLLPVAGVAAAYGPSTDPSYELVVSVPYRMIRLVLLRTVSVLVTSMPIMVAAGLLLPWQGSDAVAWVLPSLAFTVAVLGSSVWVDPSAAAGAVAIGWVGAVAASARYGDILTVLAPAALVGYAALMLAGALLLTVRAASPKDAWRLPDNWSLTRAGREP